MKLKKVPAYAVKTQEGELHTFKTERIARIWASYHGGISVTETFTHVEA